MAKIIERWRPVPGYPDYEVSDFGRVKSLRHQSPGKPGVVQWRPGKILKPQQNNSGYLQVQCFRDGKKKMLCVHKLVAAAFVPNPEHKPIANHVAPFKTYNHWSNLEWATKAEDVRHAFNNGLIHRPRGREHYNYRHGRYVGARAKAGVAGAFAGDRAFKASLK